jgi:predicted nucleotidyltransferase
VAPVGGIRNVSGVPRIPIDRDKIAEFCQKWRIAEFALFGSVLRDDFGPDSDVDVLLQFQPGHTPGWEIVDLADELGTLLGGRKVDIVNPRYLDKRLRRRVLADAVVQYEAPHAA